MLKIASSFYNLILIATIIGLAIGLFNLNAKVNSLVLYNTPITTDDATNSKQTATKESVAKKTLPVSWDLEILDGAFSPAGFPVDADQKITIIVTNNGESAHSFVIDELNVNSGIIDPGESREIAIDRQFAESKNYAFYSNAEGDDPQTFRGVLMVTK